MKHETSFSSDKTDQMTLEQICSIYRTDKNCVHSYIRHLYEDLFGGMRDSTKCLLEIGVEDGGSLCMWREYFRNARIVGIDKKPCPQLAGRERIELVIGDAYSYEVADSIPDGFDIIIDDGPHTLESMTFVILEYLKKLNEKGVMVIEDFQDFNWTNILRRYIPEGFRSEVVDLRKIKGRHDDIAMVLSKV